MKHVSKIVVLLFSLAVLVSCSKEYSIETNGKTDSSSNCKLQKLIETDPVGGDAEYAFISAYDAANKVSNIQLVDSSTNSVDFSFPVSYPSGRVQVDADQYFVTGSNGKITEFHGYEYPDDKTSERLIARYTYNASGLLTKRTAEYDSLKGVTAFQIVYSYTGNNVTKAEISLNFGPALAKVGEILYEYDVSKPVKSFISLHSVASELFLFQTAVNAGLSSVNALTKATVKILNVSNGNLDSFVTNFVNYKINSKNYVTSFDVTGDDFDVAGLSSGKRYVLNYHCF